MDSIVEELSPFNSEDQVEIGLVDVNHSQSVDLVVPVFFEDHSVNNRFPPVKNMAGVEAKINHMEYE